MTNSIQDEKIACLRPVHIGLILTVSLLFSGYAKAQSTSSPTDIRSKPAGSQNVAESEEETIPCEKQKADPSESSDKGRVERLAEIVVTATRDEDLFYRTPINYGAGRDVIGPREVRESGVLNSQELLRRTPSTFFFEETGTDSKPNISVRGVTSGSEGTSRSANVSLLSDGIPLAPAPYGHAGQSLFPFTLERVNAVDILRGGHTVRYGPNTVSGIINFLTRPIPRQPMLDQRFKINSYGDFSSYFGAGGTHEKFGFLAESVYKIGETYRDHGDFNIQNHALKMSYQFTGDLRGVFQLEYFKDDSDLADGLSLEAFRRDPEQSLARKNRFEGDQTRGNFNLEWTPDDQNRLEFSGYAFGGDRTFFLGKPSQYGSNPDYIDATPRPMSVWALQPKYTRLYELGDVEGELVSGIRYHVEDITRKSKRIYPDGTVLVRSNNEYDYHVWSAFVENTFRFDRFSLTPGVRMENVDIDGKNKLTYESVNRDFSEVLPALSGSYLIQEDWSVYANVQSSFLPPQANHVEISDKPQNIEAQYAWTIETGTRGRLWDGLLSPDLTFYSINYRDRIERDPDQDDVYVNKGNTKHQGVELAMDGDLGACDDSLEGLRFFGGISYNDSEYKTGEFRGNQVPHAPHWLASWGASYHHKETGCWGGLDGYYVGRAYADSENTGPISDEGTRGRRPCYAVWNARTGYEIKLAKDAKLQFQIGCNNIFDKEYFEIRAGKGLFLGAPLGFYSMLGITIEF